MATEVSSRGRFGIAIALGLVVGALAGAIEAIVLSVSSPAEVGPAILYGLGLYGALGVLSGLGLAVIWTLVRLTRVDRHAVVVALAFHSVFFVLLLVGYRLNKIRGVPPAGTPAGMLVNGLFLLVVVALGSGLAVLVARRKPEIWVRPVRVLTALFPVLIALPILVLFLGIGWTFLWGESGGDVRSAGPEADRKGPDVIILLSDALRSDHLSGYGYERRTSPAIDHLMDEAVTFENAFASSNLTIPSIASFFTGMGPAKLGSFQVGSPMPETATTFAESMADAGYLCGCFLGNEIVEVGPGFRRGFHYRYPPPRPVWFNRVQTAAERIALRFIQGSDPRGGPRVLGDARTWIEKNRERSLFTFVHLLDPHSPYDPPPAHSHFLDTGYDGPQMRHPPLNLLPPYLQFKDWEVLEPGQGAIPDSQRRNMVDRYDGEIAYVDELIGDFLDWLRAAGLYDTALVLITADHGEEFYEHQGWFHGQSLYDELVRIPLIVKFPGQARAGWRRTDPVVGFDIMPSVLTAVGCARPDGVEGVNVFGVAGVQPEERPVFSERPPYLYSVRQGTWKLVWKESREGPDLRLFDLREDPEELVNVADRHPEERDRLAEMVASRVVEFPTGTAGPEGAELNPYDRERLKALGYLQ